MQRETYIKMIGNSIVGYINIYDENYRCPSFQSLPYQVDDHGFIRSDLNFDLRNSEFYLKPNIVLPLWKIKQILDELQEIYDTMSSFETANKLEGK